MARDILTHTHTQMQMQMQMHVQRRTAASIRRASRMTMLFFVLAAAFSPAALRAGINEWTSIGPYGSGGTVHAIVVDTTSPGVIYVGTDGGVFKSIDGGTSWSSINSGLTAFTVHSIAIDPTASGTLYAGTNAGVFKTVNGGNSWTAQRAGLGLVEVRSLAIDPDAHLVIYAGTESGVSRSDDGGATWTGSSSGLLNFDVRVIALDPSNSSAVYAGTAQGVYKSTDGATSWSSPSSFRSGIRALSLDPSTGAIYAGAEGLLAASGIFTSTDGGVTWVSSAAGIGHVTILSMAMAAGQPSTLYTGTEGAGVFVTHDAGASWHNLPASPSNVNAIALDATGAIVYAGTSEGFLRSSDAGQTWVPQTVAFSTFAVDALQVDPASSTTLYAGVNRLGSGGGGVFKTTNAGATWTFSSNGLPDRTVQALAANGGTPGSLFAALASSGIFVSRDGGATWTATNTGLTTLNVNTIALGNSTIVYAGTDSGVFRSTDAGATWVHVSAGLTVSTVLALAVDPTAPQVVYAGTAGGVFKSSDGGENWTPSSGGLANVGVLSLVIDPSVPSTIYAGTFSTVTTGALVGSGVYRSDDGSVTWVPANSGLEGLAVTALVTDSTGSAVFAATPQGVYRSTRGATAWLGVNEGLAGRVVGSLAVDPAVPSRVYAGTNDDSVFQISFDAGAGACTAGPSTLCLNGNRFQVDVQWHADLIGTAGVGMAIPLTSDTGAFWFFTSGNVELVLKVVDGRAFNQSYWVFYGAMSNVAYTITVKDTLTGAIKTYDNPQGQLASVADTSAFPVILTQSKDSVGASASASLPSRSAGAAPVVSSTTVDPAPCTGDATSLCLNANRFTVTVHWAAANIGQSGQGQAVPLSSDSGSFWFFTSGNLELNIKVVDGRAVNGHFWVFYGALSDVQYTITVTDTETGVQRSYNNPQGNLASVADTAAF